MKKEKKVTFFDPFAHSSEIYKSKFLRLYSFTQFLKFVSYLLVLINNGSFQSFFLIFDLI